MAALSGGQKAKALYDYEARAQDELGEHFDEAHHAFLKDIC